VQSHDSDHGVVFYDVRWPSKGEGTTSGRMINAKKVAWSPAGFASLRLCVSMLFFPPLAELRSVLPPNCFRKKTDPHQPM
jgi:hypothetical protein